MIKLIVKKENELDCTSYTEIKEFMHKGIKYWIYKCIKQKQGYEVEELESD